MPTSRGAQSPSRPWQAAKRATRLRRRSLRIAAAHRNRHHDLLFVLSSVLSESFGTVRSLAACRKWIATGGGDVSCSPRRRLGDQRMGRHSLSVPARFQRRVISVLGVIPNAPTHRRDTIECALECGHARSVLRINRGEAPIADQCRDLIGAELQCAKCAVLERIRRKARVRGNRRTLTGWATSGSSSSGAS
jgi:hypothetical protein